MHRLSNKLFFSSYIYNIPPIKKYKYALVQCFIVLDISACHPAKYKFGAGYPRSILGLICISEIFKVSILGHKITFRFFVCVLWNMQWLFCCKKVVLKLSVIKKYFTICLPFLIVKISFEIELKILKNRKTILRPFHFSVKIMNHLPSYLVKQQNY